MHDVIEAWVPIRWLLFLHILAAFAFVLAHGPSIVAMVLLARERDVPKVHALLDISRRASGWSGVTLGLLALTGALLAAAEHSWASPWVWGSILVLVLLAGSMSPLAARAFNEARSAAGLPWFDGRGIRPPEPPDEPAFAQALATLRARTPLVVGLGTAGLGLLVWLMTYKPG